MKKKLLFILIAIAIAGLGVGVWATSNPHSWTDGLVGYWSFDGQYTTTTSGVGAGTRDVSNNGNWGTLNGGVKPTAGISGQALSFDGVDDYVSVADNANLNFSSATPLTMSAWVYNNLTIPVSTNFRVIMAKYPDSNAGYGLQYGYYLSGAYPGYLVWAGFFGGREGFINLQIQTGQWYYIESVYDGTNWTIYINGVAQTTTNQGSGSLATASPLIFGRFGDSAGRYQNGSIDEVRVYNRALSANEVLQHYKQTRRNFVMNQPSGTPPVGWWKMDEPTGATVRDYSVSGNNGTVSNGGYGATSTDGKIGKALNFDGSDDYVSLATAAPPNALTVSGWVNPSSTANYGTVWGHAATDGYSATFFAVANGVLFIDCEQNGGNRRNWTSSGNTIVSGSWQHLAVTQASCTATPNFYINGILQTANLGTSIGTPARVSAAGAIGRPGAQNGNYFNGLIDDVRAYNYVRTADQIAADYRAGAYRTIVGASVPSNWWTDGLVGYWNFDGKNTTTTSGANAGTRDTSGNNNWGTFNGGVKPASGVVGQALNFDGVDDYVDALDSNSLDMAGAFSITAWIKPTGTYGNFIMKGTNFSNPINYYWNLGSATVMEIGARNPAYFYRDATVELPSNVWSYVTATYSGSGATSGFHIYVNGVEATYFGQGGSGALSTNSNSLKIGGTSGNFAPWVVDELRIYNRMLSAAEIMQQYQQSKRNLKI